MEKLEFYKSEKISKTATRIWGITGELMYLVEGTEKAALIDTGTGVGNLKEYVETLTTKPLVVLITHGHIDHAMSAPLFEGIAEVYMNGADIQMYCEHGEISYRKNYVKLCIGSDFDKIEEDEYVPLKELDFKPLSEGDVFELGGVTLDIFQLPGHTAGSIVILMREERALLLGDACNFFTFMFLEDISIEEYMKNLTKFQVKVAGRFDKVYLSHGDGDAPKEIVEGVILVCQDILEGNTDDVPFEFLGNTAYIAKARDPVTEERIDGGIGNIVYRKDNVRRK